MLLEHKALQVYKDLQVLARKVLLVFKEPPAHREPQDHKVYKEPPAHREPQDHKV